MSQVPVCIRIRVDDRFTKSLFPPKPRTGDMAQMLEDFRINNHPIRGYDESAVATLNMLVNHHMKKAQHRFASRFLE